MRLLCELILVVGLTFGLGWGIAAQLNLAAVEKIVVSVALSLVGVFLGAWAIYVWALPAAWLWVLPLLSVASLALGFRSLVNTLRDAEARDFIVLQGLLLAWCLGWLALVVNYSGGGWVGDCYEHWERARFFAERWSPDHLFLKHHALTARPPLANVVTAALLQLTRLDFAHYQAITTLLSSLVFLPAGLFARRFAGGRSGVALLAVLLMASPLFVENATFPWTKLPSAFFVLFALYFFRRAQETVGSVTAATLVAVGLGAGLITHYSTGPYAVLLAIAWFACGWPQRRDLRWWRVTALGASVGAALLATWVAWAVSVYSYRGTFLSNTTVAEQAPTIGAQLLRIAANVRDTVVPHFLRSLDTSLIAQTSPWGHVRDWWFQLYQLNLFFVFGSVAWLVLLVLLAQEWRRGPSAARTFWAIFIPALIGLGIAVHGARDTWGLAHICLQPLVLLGLAFLAARGPTLAQGWKALLLLGAVFDLLLGIALHFAVQNFWFDRWLAPERQPASWFANYSAGSQINLSAKLRHQLEFFGDSTPAGIVAVILLGVLLLACLRARGPARATAVNIS